MNYFDSPFKENLKKCVHRLYDRDKRIGLFPADFWVMDKSLDINVYTSDALVKMVPHSLLQNAP